jgi:hypothetical protein
MNGAMAVCRLMFITPMPLCTKKKLFVWENVCLQRLSQSFPFPETNDNEFIPLNYPALVYK